MPYRGGRYGDLPCGCLLQCTIVYGAPHGGGLWTSYSPKKDCGNAINRVKTLFRYQAQKAKLLLGFVTLPLQLVGNPSVRAGLLPLLLCVFGLTMPLIATAASPPKGSVLVEAESFADYGGWVDDSQFMDQMGSPFLLAHGLGRPVSDATTQVVLPAAGRYRVWVRTRDWVATWNAPGAPGRFQLAIDGQALSLVFGTEGAEWHWQDGGIVDIRDTAVTLSLHDLTGFEGRCDAILFVPATAEGFVPPNDLGVLTNLRRKMRKISIEPEDVGAFDLVVVGGGIAGSCAAISAARYGLQVALIQDRPVLGGNNSSEVRVWLQGRS